MTEQQMLETLLDALKDVERLDVYEAVSYHAGNMKLPLSSYRPFKTPSLSVKSHQYLTVTLTTISNFSLKNLTDTQRKSSRILEVSAV